MARLPLTIRSVLIVWQPTLLGQQLKNATWTICGFKKMMASTSRVNMALLREKSIGCWNPRIGWVNWPARSYDLTPLDFSCGATRKSLFVRINFPLLTQKLVENYLKWIGCCKKKKVVEIKALSVSSVYFFPMSHLSFYKFTISCPLLHSFPLQCHHHTRAP